MEKLLQTKFDCPAVPLSSNPNWISPTVTSPNQPWVRSQFSTASTSIVPELVALVRTNEKTALLPFEPRYTFQVWPPAETLRAVGTAPLASYDSAIGPTAPCWLVQIMISNAKLLAQMSYAVS